ncbi:phenylalanyl-trna synthetase b3/b4 [Lucifera butyrica]|uniref:Phenylalanine--tRNA ligase beta subunit n=1 Tax=Lucifera butyrica TaxID=1351585 RepID=A0A498RCK7_9FIRM|nr:phenylalanine--tRNA ligase subunit beta [Lucifera butyrica]VBB08765.1 phenylalanyl-trna synthetase b3/b4 [Lucifera butyrica]
MRASIKWLKDYVEFSQSPQELADMLTMAGVPVAYVEELGKGIENVVTGKIIALERHPHADKLSVCKVDTGKEILTIVTGATNIRQGHVVPVALVGAKLPSGVEIGLTDLRGIASAGMMCSAEELNMDTKIIPVEARDGIYILPSDTRLGVDIRSVLGLDDFVLEFELTANRADCFSVLGLAREIAVLTGGTLRKPMLTLREEGREKAPSLAAVTIEEPTLCPRFTARVLQNIKIGPSPLWLQQRIQAAGMRPISNVVDVTNFVMLEMGQPMHAYDYNLVSRHELFVRKANPGEKITTLDGTKRELNPDMLVIADAVQAVGVAGVMGGLATEVTANTKNVLLEAAAFQGVSIRKTSRVLGLRSEASGRFERGIDTANIVRALDRAAKLLEEMGACQVCPGIIDSYPGLALPRQVTFTPTEINAHLGTDIPKKAMVDILRRLEFETDAQGDKIVVTVPSWRGDVTRAADISEEIARIYGYNRIQSTTPCSNMARGSQSSDQTAIDQIKDILSGIGFYEVISFSFTHPSIYDKLNFPEDSRLRCAIPLMNPITDDYPLLRTTLLGGTLETAVRNFSRKNDDFKIYEVGNVYWPDTLPLTDLPVERMMLCGALTGKRQETAWNSSRDTVDFYDAKGAIETLLEQLGVTGYEVAAGEHASLHPGKTAIFCLHGEEIGIVGEVHPKVQSAFAINRKIYVFEVNLQALIKHASFIKPYCALPKYPAIQRDLALVLPETTPASEVVETIKACGGTLLTAIRLFDVYTGEQVAQGLRSLAFSLTFRALDRTLTDNEVDDYYKKIIVHLEDTLTAKLRT